MRRTSRAAASASRSVPSQSCSVSTTRRSCSGQPARGEVDHVVRLLMFLLGMFTTGRPGRQAPAWSAAGYTGSGTAAAAVGTDTFRPGGGADWQGRTAPLPPWPPQPEDRGRPPGPAGRPPRRWRIPRLVTWSAVLLVIGLIFR